MRPGNRSRKIVTSANAMLLAALGEKLGGPVDISRVTGMHKQFWTNCRSLGRVPLRHVTQVSEALGICKWGLNYEGLSRLFKKIPSWKDVVNSYGLDRTTVERILVRKPPKNFNDTYNKSR